jgi:predicted nucleic acid-binding protein
VASDRSSTLVMCDAGPLIHLDELKCLDLLAVYTAIWVPSQVWQEVRQHRPSALRKRRLRLQRIDLIPDASPELALLKDNFDLDAGEEQAFRLLEQHRGAKLLSDDGAARAAAEYVGYQVTGTIGTILDALADERRTRRQVINLLKAIPQKSTLFVRRSFLKEIIVQVQEGTRES